MVSPIPRATRASARASSKRQLNSESSDPEPGSEFSSDDQYDTADEYEDNTSNRPNKRARRQVAGSEASERSTGDSSETSLFHALCASNVAVSALALDWLEEFADDEQNNTGKAITELFNLLLKACGCAQVAQEHDVINYDSAAATVEEITIVFKRQKYHEYPFISNHKSIKHFRKNIFDFFDKIVSLSHENGALYRPEASESSSSLGSTMMNTILAWLVALSTSKVRPFRFTATLILLHVQNSLCKLTANIINSCQIQQRSLNNARNSQNSRNQAAQERRIVIISESIKNYNLQVKTIREHIDEIFLSVFVHRYRDVDAHIRSECMKYLSLWMMSYKELFLQADHLRYFGWLLSDPSEVVKTEVLKSLLKLYKFIGNKREAMGVGFSQFTERFKSQFLNMLWREKSSLKMNLLDILTELYFLGFLEQNDTYEVCSYGFHLIYTEPLIQSSNKVKTKVSKFATVVSEESARLELEKYHMFLDSHECAFFDESDCQSSVVQFIRIKALINFIGSSILHYEEVEQDIRGTSDVQNIFRQALIEGIFKNMYDLPEYQGTWECLVQYYLCDFSSLTFTPKDEPSSNADTNTAAALIASLDLETSFQSYILMSLISASLVNILTKPKSNNLRSDADDSNIVVPRLIKYIFSLEANSRSSPSLYSSFLNLWNCLLIALPSSIIRVFVNTGSISDYNLIHEKVLLYYADIVIFDEELKNAYAKYFSIVLKGFGALSNHDFQQQEKILNTALCTRIEDLLFSLTSDGAEILLSDTSLDDSSNDDESSMLPNDQKVSIKRLLGVCTTFEKLTQLASVTNINKYVGEPISGSSKVLLDILQMKLLSKIDMLTIIQYWPNNYYNITDQMSRSWNAVLDFILLTFTWKLEDLTHASNDYSAQSIDISIVLDDFNGIFGSVYSLCISVGNALDELNEVTADSNVTMKALVDDLVALQLSFAGHFIDLLISIRSFHQRVTDGNQFKNFQSFFENPDGMGKFIFGSLPKSLQKFFLKVFLIEETRLAKYLNKSLDRESDEGVNFEEFICDETTQAQTTNTASGVSKSSQKVWSIEKSLCIYSIKMIALMQSGAFDNAVLKRLRLNNEKLGDLFKEVIQSTSSADASTEETNLEESASLVAGVT